MERCKPPRTAEELARAAQAAVGEREITVEWSPLLPGRWPDPDGTSVVLGYESVPSSGGMVAFEVSGPAYRVSFSKAGEPTVEKIGGGSLGSEKRRGGPPEGFRAALLGAQNALLEVLAGCRTADSARGDLAAYRTWIELHPAIGADLRRRAGAFLDWLR
jgi:hypothetical protein